MTQVSVNGEELKSLAQDAVREASPWLERLGRFGFVAKGVVYAIVGVLAAQTAFGIGGEPTDPQGALEVVLQAPFGQALLALLTVGLVGYAVWRFVQAAADTECKGTDLPGLWARGAYVVIGLIYLGLAYSAADALVELPGGDVDDSVQGWTAWLLAKPLGQWLTAAVGGVVIFSGLFQLLRAFTADFCKRLRLYRMSDLDERWAIRLGRLGFAARGVAFTIMGGFLTLAAIHENPREAHGLGETLALLAGAPYGPWLLGVVAAGLLAHGIYMLVEARYRRMVIC